MIIAAWPGTGKSFLGNRYKNILDAESSRFQYIIKEKLNRIEFEKQKKNQRLKNPKWPDNYIKYVLSKRNKYDIVMVPLLPDILNYLYEHKIEFTIVFPKKELKEEYKKRYLYRGNNPDYVKAVYENWECGLDLLDNYFVKKYCLNKGEYLINAIKKMGINLIEKKKKISIRFPARIEGNSVDIMYTFKKHRLGGGYGFSIYMDNIMTIENKQKTDKVITSNEDAKKLIEFYIPLFKKKFLVNDNIKVVLNLDKKFINHSGIGFNLNLICALAYCFRDLYMPYISNDKLIKYLYTFNYEIINGKISPEIFTGIGHNCAFYGGISLANKYGKLICKCDIPEKYKMILIKTDFERREISSFDLVEKSDKYTLIAKEKYTKIMKTIKKNLVNDNMTSLKKYNLYLQSNSTFKAYIETYKDYEKLLSILNRFDENKDNIVGITYSKPNIYVITENVEDVIEKVKEYNYEYSIFTFSKNGIEKIINI